MAPEGRLGLLDRKLLGLPEMHAIPGKSAGPFGDDEYRPILRDRDDTFRQLIAESLEGIHARSIVVAQDPAKLRTEIEGSIHWYEKRQAEADLARLHKREDEFPDPSWDDLCRRGFLAAKAWISDLDPPGEREKGEPVARSYLHYLCRRLEALPGRSNRGGSMSRGDANKAMLTTLQGVDAARDWTVRKWATETGCSPSTISKTEAWQAIMTARKTLPGGRVPGSLRPGDF